MCPRPFGRPIGGKLAPPDKPGKIARMLKHRRKARNREPEGPRPGEEKPKTEPGLLF